MLPSPAELEYFVEVAHTLNLSRAAERLGISQPSLSLAIKRLEKTIGVHLFIRHRQGVLLTQSGKQLLAHVRKLFQYWENAKSQALASSQEIQGCFTLGCPSTIAMHIVSKFLPDFLEAHPNIEIILVHDISRKIIEKLNHLSIDIAIGVNPIKHPDLIIRKLCDDKTTFWRASGKRKIQNIHSEKAILICDSDLTQTQWLLKQCNKNKIKFDRIINSNSLETIACLTANGGGIGIIPHRVASIMYPQDLKAIPKMPSYSDEICVMYHTENRNIQAIQELFKAIRAYFR